jgi:capsular polysaccharide biosynthesis protein
MAGWLDPQARAEGASEAIALLPGGRVVGDGIVLAGDGRTLAGDVSLDFGREPRAEHWLLGNSELREPRFLPGRTAVIATALGSSYAHWLLDELPRLVSLGVEAGKTPLIAHADADCRRTAFALAQCLRPAIVPVRRAHWVAEELVVPALPGWIGRSSPRHAEMIREFVRPLRSAQAVGGERIYVSRAPARRRRVLNEPEVVRALGDRGFVCVELEHLTWAEQIELFRRAKAVVAPHGAGLANIVFCGEGARIVECFGRDYINACFWQLAMVCRLDYTAVIPADAGTRPPDPKRNRIDFTIDVPALLAALG